MNFQLHIIIMTIVRPLWYYSSHSTAYVSKFFDGRAGFDAGGGYSGDTGVGGRLNNDATHAHTLKHRPACLPRLSRVVGMNGEILDLET